MKQPYIYTMPERFLTDQEVPARWRVWGVLNGFFINNQKCWASNEWLGEKIGAHKDTVSKAVSELETLNLIRCERTRRSRFITPIYTEIGVDAYQRPPSTPISDRRGRLSISDSISDNLTIGADARIIEVSEEEKTPKPKSKYANARALFKEVFGPKYPLAWNTNSTQLTAGENLYTEHGIEEAKEARQWYLKNRPPDFALSVSTPHDLDRNFPKIEEYFNKIRS